MKYFFCLFIIFILVYKQSNNFIINRFNGSSEINLSFSFNTLEGLCFVLEIAVFIGPEFYLCQFPIHIMLFIEHTITDITFNLTFFATSFLLFLSVWYKDRT